MMVHKNEEKISAKYQHTHTHTHTCTHQCTVCSCDWVVETTLHWQWLTT